MFNDNEPIEAKNILFLSERDCGEDIHIVKEVVRDENGYKDNIKIIKDYKRPFWVTKPLYRDYKDKKESEDKSKVDTFYSTESKLYPNISRRLGELYTGITDPRSIKKSPYVYGSDIDSRTVLKFQYNKKYNSPTSPYRVGVFDIEVNVLTNEIILITFMSDTHIKTAVLKSFVKNVPNLDTKVNELYDKYIPENDFKTNCKLDLKVFDDELSMIKWIFKEANYGNVDILTAWNIKYDITVIVDKVIEKGERPEDVMHYDKIPNQYKHYKFIEGRSKKITEAGREIPVSPEEQWHVIRSSTNFYMIDAMASHRYIRTGGATVPGGYSLDNILQYEKVAKKLQFDSEQGYKGIEWHIYMVKHKPVEYIIYNIWDVMSMKVMDAKTLDLTTSLPLLSDISHFDIFNSGPKRIVDALLFFYLEHDKVLGVKDMTESNNKLLGLDSWVITLQAHMTTQNGIDVIDGINDNVDKTITNLITNIKKNVADADQASGYPSNTMAANVSKDTTHRELVGIEGMSKKDFMLHNINLTFGSANSLEYSQVMFRLPTLFTLIDNLNLIKEKNH